MEFKYFYYHDTGLPEDDHKWLKQVALLTI
jgi:hypothetical protein